MSTAPVPTSRSGYVAIVGRPNVGKSTLLNHLLGQKLSITSRKPQTTRHTILGVKTVGDDQIIFVDTPGLHRRNNEKAINRLMNRAATTAISDVDMVVLVVDQLYWGEEDEWVAEHVERADCPVLIVINKVDKLKNKAELLPHIQTLLQRLPQAEVVPVSALQGDNLDHLTQLILERLPEGPSFFPPDQITDRSERFLAAEIIREKIMRQLGAEVPYQITVEIEDYQQVNKVLHISALILVERQGQKRILIGEKGSRIKNIGQQARKDLERLVGSQVMLNLWVKVKSGWSDDERALKSLGYDDYQG